MRYKRYLQSKYSELCTVYEGLHCGKPADFIGEKGNNAGLNRVILNIILAGKRDLDFSLKFTIELYHYLIKNNSYTWKLLCNILLNISTFNKVIDGNVLCKNSKSSYKYKVVLMGKKTDDLKTFDNVYFIFPDSSVFLANNIEPLTIINSNNDNE